MKREYQRALIFTKAPLGGLYRYKDFFQIFPLEMDGMPKSSFQKHYPNILELWVSEEDKAKAKLPKSLEEFEQLFSTINASLAKQDKILGLLTTFSNNLFFRYIDTIGFWGFPLFTDEPEEEANKKSSSWLLKMYSFPEFRKQVALTSFSEIKLPQVDLIPHKKFYMYYPSLDYDTDSNILLPDTIDLLFKSYYSLDEINTMFIDAAVSYVGSAVELMDSKKTLSLLSSFTAMETMVNLEFKDIKPEVCPHCGQAKYSVARKFREYLLKYIGNTVANKKKYNSYYQLRSKIVHTGRQLQSESLFTDVSKDIREVEIVTRTEILQIGKLAVVNWLLNMENSLDGSTYLFQKGS